MDDTTRDVPTIQDRRSFYEHVLAIASTAREPGSDAIRLEEVPEDANLFDLGVVDSLSMIEVLASIEAVTAREVDFLEVDPETFFTLAGMWEYLETHRA
jgi:acyl carrier protein